MVPYSYNMVDMGGIDLAEANGTVVPGVYERITEAMNLCGDVILYNWKFAGIGIVPSAYAILQQTSSILINGMIQVTELDEITVIAIEPPIVSIEPLEVTENGVYEAEPPVSGFSPVTVIVPERQPVIEPIIITENGTYTAPTGKDGYSPVTVNVQSSTPVIEPIIITENGTYTAPTGKDGYSPVTVNVPQLEPTIQSLSVTENGTYTAPAGVDGFAPVTVNVSSGPSFLGDGREYLFDWKFGSDSGRIYVSKTGHMVVYSGFPEIDGEFIYEAVNSEIVTAKSNCYTRVSTSSLYSAEVQEVQGDTISSAITDYGRLVIAYESSGQTSQYEIGVGWSLGPSAIRFIIKPSGVLVPHAATSIQGEYLISDVPGNSGGLFYVRSDFIGDAFGDAYESSLTMAKDKVTQRTLPFLSQQYGAICFAKAAI